MENFFQIIGTLASIFGIPLAIYTYIKSSNSKDDKVRHDIIKTLSYKIGEGNSITASDVLAVYNSKLREYNLKNPSFSEYCIIEDLISDVLSNPFLNSSNRNEILTILNAVHNSMICDKSDIITEQNSAKMLRFFKSSFLAGSVLAFLSLVITYCILINLRNMVMHEYNIPYFFYFFFNLLGDSYYKYNVSVFTILTFIGFLYIYVYLRKKEKHNRNR